MLAQHESNINIRFYIRPHRLRVFENSVLRRIYGPSRDEVKGEWIKPHNEELHDLYPHPLLCG
jgi:hypothetical protein